MSSSESEDSTETGFLDSSDTGSDSFGSDFSDVTFTCITPKSEVLLRVWLFLDPQDRKNLAPVSSELREDCQSAAVEELV